MDVQTCRPSARRDGRAACGKRLTKPLCVGVSDEVSDDRRDMAAELLLRHQVGRSEPLELGHDIRERPLEQRLEQLGLAAEAVAHHPDLHPSALA